MLRMWCRMWWYSWVRERWINRLHHDGSSRISFICQSHSFKPKLVDKGVDWACGAVNVFQSSEMGMPVRSSTVQSALGCRTIQCGGLVNALGAACQQATWFGDPFRTFFVKDYAVSLRSIHASTETIMRGIRTLTNDLWRAICWCSVSLLWWWWWRSFPGAWKQLT